MTDFDFTQGLDALSGWPLVGSYDIAGAYETDEGTVHLTPDDRFYYRHAQDCSCWDGSYDSEVYDSLKDLKSFGLGCRWTDLVFEPEYKSFEEEWKDL